MFVKLHDDFVNLDNVACIGVDFIRSCDDRVGLVFDYRDERGKVYHFHQNCVLCVVVRVGLANEARVYKFDISSLYRKCFDRLRECNEGSCNILEHVAYCRALAFIFNSGDDIRLRVIKEVNKYKSSGGVVLLDLGSTIFNYYKTLDG